MENVNKFKLIIAVLFLLVMNSCEQGRTWDCIASTKGRDSIWVNLSHVDSFWLKGPLRAYFVPTKDTCAIKIVAARDLLNNVRYRQKGKTLYVEETSRCRWMRDLHYFPSVWIYFNSRHVYIRPDNYDDNFFVKDFDGEILAIDYWLGRGTTYVRGRADSMKFWVNAGGGSFVVKGQASWAYVYHHGNGKMFFKQLETDTLIIDQYSNNDVYASVNKVFFVSIHHTGNVYYSGKPIEILLKKFGKGELMYVDE